MPHYQDFFISSVGVSNTLTGMQDMQNNKLVPCLYAYT